MKVGDGSSNFGTLSTAVTASLLGVTLGRFPCLAQERFETLLGGHHLLTAGSCCNEQIYSGMAISQIK